MIALEEKETKNALCEELSVDVNKLNGTVKELQNEIKITKKSIVTDGKKLAINQKKLESAEKKLATIKEKKTKQEEESASTITELIGQISEEKEIQTELTTKCAANEKEANECKAVIKDLEELKDKAFAESAKNKELSINVQLESDSKIKEMMYLLEQYKKENEVNISQKDVEIKNITKEMEQLKSKLVKTISEKNVADENNICLHNKLTEQTANHAQFKNVIQTLSKTQSPKQNSSTEPLKTPSPSVYLSLCRPQSSIRSHKTPTKLTPMLPSITEKKILQRFNFKKVSFKSPLLDSDSSDYNTLELASDMEDKFEALKNNGSRNKRNVKVNLPHARVQPLTVSNDSVNKPPQKKLRSDKSGMKTYSSPGFAKKEVENKKPIVIKNDEKKKKNNVSLRNVLNYD